MKRRLLSIAAAISLLVLLGIAAAWIRSYWRADHLHFWWDQTTLLIRSNGGTLEFWWETDEGLDFRREVDFWQEPAWRHGFWGEFEYVNVLVATVVMVPHWLAMIVTPILPSYWLVTRRRHRNPNACGACGYDLRGTTLGDACPECGASPAGEKPHAAGSSGL